MTTENNNNSSNMVDSESGRFNVKTTIIIFAVLALVGVVGAYADVGSIVNASDLSKQKGEIAELAQDFCHAKLIELREGMFGANMEEFNATEAGATIDLIKTDEGCFQYAGSYLYNHAINDSYPPATESLGK